MKDNADIVVAIITLIGGIYKFAKLEEKINDKIQFVDSKLEVHIKEYQVRKEWIDYLLHGLDAKIDHKFNRIYEEIKNLH
jgi:hypothetical protein